MLRVDRPPNPSPASAQSSKEPTADLLTRHKSSIALNLKSPAALSLLRALLRKADVFIDPFRPGVLESLGLDPSHLLKENSRLIVARLTGFRRDGRYAQMAGHDINYLAVSGILSQLGRSGQMPYAPANILADFAGGGLTCALGILLALLSRRSTGHGQIVEANMVDGSAYLGTFMRLQRSTQMWNGPRGENLLDGGCPWYDVYECKGGGYMAVGALEPKFLGALIHGLGLERDWVKKIQQRVEWPELRRLMTARFLEKERKEWEEVFSGKDACCTPVLEQEELEAGGYEQRPAVRLSSSPGLEIPPEEAWIGPGLDIGTGGERLLHEWMGWKEGTHYAVEKGGLIKLETAKF